VKATEVTAGLAESNGSLLPGLWRDSLHVTCGLTAYTPGSAPGPTLGNEYGTSMPVNKLHNAMTVLACSDVKSSFCAHKLNSDKYSRKKLHIISMTHNRT